jgi:hypothetical protein
LKTAVLVGHRPAGDLLDVDLAPEHHAKVLLCNCEKYTVYY